MKTSSAVALLVGGAVVVGGIAWAVSKKSSTEPEPEQQDDPRVVRVYDGFNNTPGVWAFQIYAGPATQGTPPVVLHGPDGPYASQEAAQTAGNNWLAEHPLV